MDMPYIRCTLQWHKTLVKYFKNCIAIVIHLQTVNTRLGHAIYPLYTAMAQNTCEIFQKLNCNRHSPSNGQYTALTCHISAVHCNGTTHLRNISKIELQSSFTFKRSIHAMDMPYIRCTLQWHKTLVKYFKN